MLAIKSRKIVNPLPLSLPTDVGSAVVTQKETEEKEGALVSSPSLEQELAAVNLDQDTDSMLAALNNDIMQMVSVTIHC